MPDEPGRGGPVKFSAEQVVQIVAMSCEAVTTSSYPVSHWTPKEVAAEAVKRGIVTSLSLRQVGRFLK
jgi:putative transposase